MVSDCERDTWLPWPTALGRWRRYVFRSGQSASAVRGYLEAAGPELVGRVGAISIGPITSQTLRDHHWEPATEADPHDIPGLVAATTRALSPDL